MIVDVGLLIEKFDNLEDILSKYGKLTNRLSVADLELTDKTDVIFEEREKLIEQMRVIKPQITELINKQSTDKAEAIRKMLTGETVMADFSDDEKAVQTKVINLRSLQCDIVRKDDENKIRFKRKYDEIRGELENLQKDKKKLNFYHNAKVDVKGSAFDNQS
ncbi:MAG: hypothetical protein FWH08_03520 [Oscillospiraceae bacterium]|nr:hypothetical protein [Oscillospiraceae bacterium]